MEFADILTLIGNYVFPIVACIALFWLVIRQGDQHKAEMTEIRNTIENNTKALLKLAAKLDEEDNVA